MGRDVSLILNEYTVALCDIPVKYMLEFLNRVSKNKDPFYYFAIKNKFVLRPLVNSQPRIMQFWLSDWFTVSR